MCGVRPTYSVGLMQLAVLWKNDLEFAFMDILEEGDYGIVRDKQVMIYPISERARTESQAALQELARAIDALPEEEDADWLAGLPSISIPKRGATPGSMSTQIKVVAIGKMIFTVWEIGFNCSIFTLRSFSVVRNFMIGGWINGTSDM